MDRDKTVDEYCMPLDTVPEDSVWFKQDGRWYYRGLQKNTVGGGYLAMPEGNIKEGMHYDENKLRVDLVPPEAIEAIAEVLGYGCKKYEARNWEKGIKFSRLYGSFLRHTLAWAKRDDYDKESGLHHLKHALWNLMALVTYTERGMTKFDDRPSKDWKEGLDTPYDEVEKSYQKIRKTCEKLDKKREEDYKEESQNFPLSCGSCGRIGYHSDTCEEDK